MKADRRQGPQAGQRLPGRSVALFLAIAVHAAFIAVLIFSIRWQNRPPEPVTAELYAPSVATPPPVAVPQPPPEPVVEPPAPRPEPVVPPTPAPKAAAKPVPAIEKPDPHAAEIALKARQEEERRKKDAAEKERKERERKDAERRVAEEKKRADDKRVAETRERQLQETEALRAEAQRETQTRAVAEAQAKAKAETQAREVTARSASEADWIRRIQSKVRGNVTVPPELPGNPEAIFEVVQLPTGEIIDVQLRKSSGARAYDDAVQRAILKSSPLPRPERAELFTRSLTLKFRPLD